MVNNQLMGNQHTVSNHLHTDNSHQCNQDILHQVHQWDTVDNSHHHMDSNQDILLHLLHRDKWVAAIEIAVSLNVEIFSKIHRKN